LKQDQPAAISDDKEGQHHMPQEASSWVIQDRVDMTDWVLHFVHEINLENEPADDMIPFERYEGMAYHENPEVNSRFGDWDYMDEHASLSSGSSAYGVLRKIISDGHIRATWAFRKGRPTIYGPRAAVCVTEMPLHALIDYAERRAAKDVGSYAVGLLKSEFFAAGGRPVIYGLSSVHKELERGGRKWPRKLAASCGIAEPEQYRYVATALDSRHRIDWTHEREWRWADHQDQCWTPGLPVWLAGEPHAFSRVLVIVHTDDEAEGVLDLMKQLHDASANEFDIEFDRRALEATAVISLEELRERLPDEGLRTVRLEDIPRRQLHKFESPPASSEDLDNLKGVLVEARGAAARAMQRKWETAPKRPDGSILDSVGFADLRVYDAQTPLVSALLELGEVFPLGGGGYSMFGITEGCKQLDQAMCLEEAAVAAARDVFEQHYPKNTFIVTSRMD